MKIFFFSLIFLFYLFRVFSLHVSKVFVYVNNSSDAYLVNEYVRAKKIGEKNGKHFPLCCKLRVPLRTFSYIFISRILRLFVYRYMTVHVLHSDIRFLDWLGNIFFFSFHSSTITDFVSYICLHTYHRIEHRTTTYCV